ncbi:hypothetical protein QGN29_08090 [Temperatibacter marinus]|uniref:Uncharacterized protein n=1 Tax=Temperatibacter marinus TaxID=1456591 RepID=A0AA52EFD6_9PROT|nr:hypothetical protein [Temperatibacter marinus]WND01519.1 hypothetical protein QGN29_08090 [Temperatibacter marinus]
MKKYALDVIIAYIVFFALWSGYGMVFMDKFEPMMAVMHPMGHMNQNVVIVLHLIQTLAMLWIWHNGVGSNDVKKGVMFGVVYGILIGATDMIWFYGLIELPQDPKTVQFVGHVVISAVVGAVLAKLYQSPDKAIDDL